MAAANHWTQAEHVTLILLYLTGSAQLFYQSLSVAVCGENLQPLLQALGDWFAPAAHIDLHRAELRTRTQQSGEQLSDYCEAVKRLARRVYPMLPANVQDALAKEQFLAGIASRPVRLDTRRRAPNSSNEALMQALQAQAIFATEDRQLEDSSPEVRGVTNKASHNTAAALQLILGRLANFQARLDRQQNSHQERDNSLRCHGCGGHGHFVSSCPNNSCQIP